MATISVEQGDITRQQVDAVVNAANEHLAHGGGVAAAIVRAGGRVIQEESTTWVRRNGPLTPGTAVVTTGGALYARWVVHVAGPRYRDDQDNEGLLRLAIRAALDATAETGARSVALPAVSTGIFGYPRAEACSLIARECLAWNDEHPTALDVIVLVGFDRATADDFRRGLS